MVADCNGKVYHWDAADPANEIYCSHCTVPMLKDKSMMVPLLCAVITAQLFLTLMTFSKLHMASVKLKLADRT